MLLAMKLSRAVLFVVALLLPGAFPGLPPSLAEEVSAEVTPIQSLSAERTKSLVAEFRVKDSLLRGANGLSLRGLTSLSAATAAELATFTGRFLELNRLSSRDAKTAKSLAGWKGQFSRNGLSTLEADAAPLAGDGS